MSIRSLLLTFVILAASTAAAAQARFSGTVVEVVDGRTLILETSAGRMTAVLQYVDTPEPEQPLHKEVRDHLSKLILGKPAEFRPLRIFSGRTEGLLVCGGLDVSMQMLRDGAAWHTPPAQSGQGAADAAEYDKLQQLARSERRGVWSIAGLKPGWQYRAEKEEVARRLEAARWQSRGVRGAVSQYQTNARPGTISQGKLLAFDSDGWMDVFAGAGIESPGIKTYVDPNQKFGSIYTSVAFAEIASRASRQRLECRAIYAWFNMPNGTTEAVYLIGFRAISEDYRFSTRTSRLTFTADRHTASLGSPFGRRGRATYGAHEIFYYRISRAQLRRIAYAANVHMRIDSLSGKLAPEMLNEIKQLLAATE